MSKKKTKKWEKRSFMRAWGELSKKGGFVETDDIDLQRKQWLAFAGSMAKKAEAEGVIVPSETACWNRLKTLKSRLEKNNPNIKCPPFPRRPRKPSAETPETAADIAADLGW